MKKLDCHDNVNLLQIVIAMHGKTVISELLQPLNMSNLGEREVIYYFVR